MKNMAERTEEILEELKELKEEVVCLRIEMANIKKRIVDEDLESIREAKKDLKEELRAWERAGIEDLTEFEKKI